MHIDVIEEDWTTYRVIVTDERGSSSHLVTVMPSDVEHYAPGATPDWALAAEARARPAATPPT